MNNEEAKRNIEIIKRPILTERAEILSWEIDSRIPHFISEKFEEISHMVILGMDNYVLKALILLLEDTLMHLYISDFISTEEDYIPQLERFEKDKDLKYGWQILKKLNDSSLIHSEDYGFCSIFCNNLNSGGQRLRNIEIHQLLSEKIKSFELDPMIAKHMDDEFAKQWLTTVMKSKPSFIHVGSKDMVSRRIKQDMRSLLDFINRSATKLSIYNNLQTKEEKQIIDGFIKSNKFRASVSNLIIPIDGIVNDIIKLEIGRAHV